MSDRVSAIEYIRGLAMLGVVGIHTGAYSLNNPDVNLHLFAALEIFTRFSVPIFFFVSAFGLFWRYQPEEPFHYGAFLRRRLRAVLLPYLVWSLFYMAHYSWSAGESRLWDVQTVVEYLLFGLASYQLYFLVILIWFYLLMPLWRALVPLLIRRPVSSLAGLLILQIAFNYYSSYCLLPDSDNYFWRTAIQYRLSYWVLHYVFVFLLGAVCAVRFADFSALLARYRRTIAAFFLATLSFMLAGYYWLILHDRYTPAEAVNTVHQLSPEGMLYTLASCLFFFDLLQRPLPPRFARWLGLLARYSFPVYLIHPLIMHYLDNWLAAAGQAMTTPVVIGFYVVTVAGSLYFGALVHKLGALAPGIGSALAGASFRPAAKGKSTGD
ncbi:MAG TPA: acyltransferase [Selenomonadales bacterium]|nr:acyltransferase [Selenomonadales bacterium]